jgi:hypothetical protein
MSAKTTPEAGVTSVKVRSGRRHELGHGQLAINEGVYAGLPGSKMMNNIQRR